MVVSAHFPPREGMGTYVWNLSKNLIKSGHQVDIITRGSRGQPFSEKVEQISIWRPFFVPVYPFHVHLHTIFCNIVLQKIVARIDLIHLHTPLVKPLKTSLPTIVTVHTSLMGDTRSISRKDGLSLLIKLQTLISIRIEKEVFAKAGKIAVVAKSLIKELELYGINPGDVSMLGNGVDTTVYCPRKVNQKFNDAYFLTVCRLGPRKGLEDLIESAGIFLKKYPGYKFLIAGSGPYKRYLEKEIKRHNIDRQVILLGHISDRARLVDLYQGATAYIHPAHYEGLSTALLEAMACGCPLISTAVSGALDVIEDGQNGLLFPPNDPERMTKTIVKIIENDKFAANLGTSARRTIELRYSWENVARNYIQLYKLCMQFAA